MPGAIAELRRRTKKCLMEEEGTAEAEAERQGLTFVPFSAQLKHFVWDRGCIKGVFRGCLGSDRGY